MSGTASLIASARRLDLDAVEALLADPAPETTARLAAEAADVTSRAVGSDIRMRGLVEFSNRCRCNCLYCGIRRENTHVRRYTLSEETVVAAAQRCAAAGYGSLTLQSGERQDGAFVDRVCRLLRSIKEETRSARLPEGLGITLSVGEHGAADYARFRAAGAHRYLLRIETSSPQLFSAIHPASQTFSERLAALRRTREAGFQVGTGVMIGIPGQTLRDLAGDIAFFAEENIDMIGMGPYIPEASTPLPAPPPAEWRLELSLRMISLARIVLGDVNIAATTALHTLAPGARARALCAGANVVMPVLTPERARASYALYDGKAGVDAAARVLEEEARAAGRTVSRNVWGDAPRARRRATHAQEESAR